MSEKLMIETKLQQLAVKVAEFMNVSSAEAVGIVANSEVGIGLKDQQIPIGVSVGELSDRLMQELKMAV